MLNFFRKNTKLIIWIVIGAFALWGAFSVGTQFQKEGRYAGQVFGKNISFQEFDRFYRATQIFTPSQEAGQAPDPNELRRNAWQAVIFSREAKALGIEIPDKEVREEILKILDQEKIAPENYAAWVERGLRQTPNEFEQQVREVMRIRRLFEKFSPAGEALKITAEEAKDIFLQEKNQTAAEFLLFPSRNDADLFREKLKTPEDWKKEKDSRPNDFKQTGLLPSAAAPSILQLNPADTLAFLALEKGHFSEPLAVGSEFGIFFITDKLYGDLKEFESSQDQYIELLKERRKQQALMVKATEILNRAQLNDFLAAPPEPAAA